MINRGHSAGEFRGDINGLRAWAVVAVMLYHFGIPGFGGGFVGVDVFFVISGFLMTGIVVRGLETGGRVWLFVMSFYMARARRILPALIVLCAVLLALGWWLLLPLDYKRLGTHVMFSVAFLSNIKFWREAGYFDAASHEKWLLHTWSLAVEWQFYLLLPLVLVAVWKLRPGRRTVIGVLAAGLLVSLGLSISAPMLWPHAAFYMLPTRAWEMLAGGLVFLLPLRRVLTVQQCATLEAAGLLLVMGAVIAFDSSSAWPGWRALLPVVGAVFVLMAARPASPWTGQPVAQWLGTRSYSIYLWHWPVVVALTYLEWQAVPSAIAAGLMMTLVLGHLSYYWVENPARRQLVKHGLAWGAAVLVCAMLAVAIPGAGIRLHEGVIGRFSPEIEVVSQEALNKNPRQAECHVGNAAGSPSCMFGGRHLRAIVIGDSHANALVSGVAAAALLPEDGVMEWTSSACPTLEGVKSTKGANSQCAAFVDWVLRELKHVPPDVAVVVVNRHASYTNGPNEEPAAVNIPLVYFSKRYTTAEDALLEEYGRHLTDTACRLAQSRLVYLVRPIPEMVVSVPDAARSMVWGRRKKISISLADYHQRNAFAWAAQDAARDRCGVKILDPLPYLCRDGRCFGAKDGRPLYQDDDHLSEFGNKVLVPMFAEVFKSPFVGGIANERVLGVKGGGVE